MSAKLVAIGDSLTQGFQSGSISKTHLSFPVMIAECLADQEFRVPDFTGEGGLPVNLEDLFRLLGKRAGNNIDWFELPQAVLSMRSFLDRVEDYWERGDGSERSETGPLHRNLAVCGFQLGDCNTLSEDLCRRVIPQPRDNILTAKQIPEYSMYRAARRTLNPSFAEQYKHLSQVELAKEIARVEGGIDNLIFFLGSNNCLGTVGKLEIKWSEEADLDRLAEKRTCNLWRPDHFRTLLSRVAEKISDIGATNVFVSTVPHVTIAPVCRGVSPGAPEGEELRGGYFEYYTHFWVWDDDFRKDPHKYKHLSREEARLIDETIDAYNDAIEAEVERRGWHVVDLCEKLDKLAYRRSRGESIYDFPEELKRALRNHPATSDRFTPEDKPIIDTRYMHVDLSKSNPKEKYEGGFFSLDGMHPTTIGYGLMAHEFLKVMSKFVETKPLDWAKIVDADTLVKEPPSTLESLRNILGFLASQGPLANLIRIVSETFRDEARN